MMEYYDTDPNISNWLFGEDFGFCERTSVENDCDRVTGHGKRSTTTVEALSDDGFGSWAITVGTLVR
jgi:hypothetical protein